VDEVYDFCLKQNLLVDMQIEGEEMQVDGKTTTSKIQAIPKPEGNCMLIIIVLENMLEVSRLVTKYDTVTHRDERIAALYTQYLTYVWHNQAKILLEKIETQ
jgi:hypothetical protein